MSAVATEQIVIELCKEIGEPGLIHSQTIWGCLLDGIRDLALHNMPTWDTAKGLSLNNYNAFEWPCGMVKPLITFIERDGKSLALDVDDNILSTTDTNVTDFETANNEIQDFFRIDNYYGFLNTYNWGFGEVYGYGSGYRSIGMVTHDKTRRQSFIKGCSIKSTDTFGVLFKSDGLSSCPTHVPAEAKEALEFFALGKYYRTRNPNLGELNRKNYKEEFTRLGKWNNETDEAGWINAVMGNTKSSPK